MVKGSLTYRAAVTGFIFARFEPVDVRVAQAGVERVVVSCPSESPITLTVNYSASPSVEAARIAGRQIARDLLNRLAVQYCLCIQEPGVPDEAFEVVGASGETVRVATASMNMVMTGKRTVAVVGTELRTELEQPSPDREVYHLFRVAMQAQDEVDRFLSLYRILLFLFPNPKDGKEEQKFVDDFIEKNTPERRVHKRPDKEKVFETVYTRLRNEIAHVRPGVDLTVTRQEMESRVHALAEVVRMALMQS